MNDDERRNWTLWTAIRRRDTHAFLSLLPKQAAERDGLLKRTDALNTAFMVAAAGIVAQILRWHPSALKDRSPDLNTTSLSELIGAWKGIDERRRDNQPVENPPAPEDIVALVKQLLDAGANPNDSGLHFGLPLGLLATMQPSPETLEAARPLLTHGASINLPDRNSRRALAYAAEGGNAEMASLMLAKRKPLQDTLDEAFVQAFPGEDEQLTLTLLNKGANPNVDATRFGVSEFHPLQMAALSAHMYGRTLLLDALIAHHADPNNVRPIWGSPLMLVMHDHHRMQALLDLGANVNYRDRDGSTALHWATRIPQTVSKAASDTRPLKEIEPAIDPETRRKSVELLLKYGADPTLIEDSLGMTALMQTGPDDAAAVAMLFEHGATVNIDARALERYRQYGASAGDITWALLHHNDALAVRLLKKDPRIKSEDCGALFYASVDGSVQTLEELIVLRADYKAATDLERMTPLIAASLGGQLQAVTLLLDHNVASVNEATALAVEQVGPFKDVTGNFTALMAAARNNHVAVMGVLVQHGADINAKDAREWTALGYARMMGAVEAVEYLEGRGAR